MVSPPQPASEASAAPGGGGAQEGPALRVDVALAQVGGQVDRGVRHDGERMAGAHGRISSGRRGRGSGLIFSSVGMTTVLPSTTTSFSPLKSGACGLWQFTQRK